MKIRAGFVSNSSSSSFMICSPEYPTTATLALRMVEIVREDYLNWHESNDTPCIGNPEMIAAILWLKENLDYNEPIAFPWSTNYETFIWRGVKGIEVDTCNNYSWWDYLPVSNEEVPVKKGFFLDLKSMRIIRCSYYFQQMMDRMNGVSP